MTSCAFNCRSYLPSRPSQCNWRSFCSLHKTFPSMTLEPHRGVHSRALVHKPLSLTFSWARPALRMLCWPCLVWLPMYMLWCIVWGHRGVHGYIHVHVHVQHVSMCANILMWHIVYITEWKESQDNLLLANGCTVHSYNYMYMYMYFYMFTLCTTETDSGHKTNLCFSIEPTFHTPFH